MLNYRRAYVPPFLFIRRSILKKFGAITLLIIGMLTFNNGQVYATSTNSGDSNKLNIVKTYNAKVSWYKHGTKTANGEKFNPNNLTVAHKNLPFGTLVRFTHPDTQKTVIARVNDRGPYIKGREFDVSLRCAVYLGIKYVGVTKLKVEILKS
jgi:rare lipoprotein A